MPELNVSALIQDIIMLFIVIDPITLGIYVAGETARRGGFVERIVEGYRRYGKAFILMIDEVDKLDSDAVKNPA